MLRFPDNRRVPPPDYTGTRVQHASPANTDVRAIVHPAAQLVTTAPAARRHAPAERGTPRTLAFEHRRPRPGTVEEAPRPALEIRAIVHAKASEPLVTRTRRTHAPAARGKPRRLAFAPSLTVSAPR